MLPRFSVVSFVTLALPQLFVSAFAAGATPVEIVKEADDVRAPQFEYSMNVKVRSVGKGDPVDDTYRVSVRGMKASLVEQTEPERLRGRKLLMLENDLWLYTPNTRRPTRVSFEQKLTGEVANGDISRTNFGGDYDPVLSGQEKVGAQEAWKLRLTAKSKDVTYHMIDYWVGKKGHVPIKAVFYAKSGKALKTATYSNLKPVLGKNRITRTVITDILQPGRQSVIDNYQYKREKFDDATFNKETLGDK